MRPQACAMAQDKVLLMCALGRWWRLAECTYRADYIVLFSVGLVSFIGVPTTVALVNDWGLEGDDYRNPACIADNVVTTWATSLACSTYRQVFLGKDFMKGSEPHKNSVTLDTVGDPLRSPPFLGTGIPYEEVRLLTDAFNIDEYIARRGDEWGFLPRGTAPADGRVRVRRVPPRVGRRGWDEVAARPTGALSVHGYFAALGGEVLDFLLLRSAPTGRA